MIALSLIEFAIIGDEMYVLNAMKSINTSFAISMSQAQFYIAVYSISGISAVLVSSYLVEKVGWYIVLMLGLVMFCLSQYSAYMAQNVIYFTYIARGLAGIAAGFCAPSVIGYGYKYFNKPQLALFLCVLPIALSMSLILAPLLSGYLITYYHWQIGCLILFFLFLSLTLLMFVSQIASNTSFKKEARKNKLNFDIYGAVLFIVSSAIVLFAASNVISWGVFYASDKAAFSLAGYSPIIPLIILGGFVFLIFLSYEKSRELRHGKYSVLFSKYFMSNSEIKAGLLTSVYMFFVFAGAKFSLIAYMQESLYKNALDTGKCISLFAFAMVIASLFAYWQSQRIPARFICRIGVWGNIVGAMFIGIGVIGDAISICFYLGVISFGAAAGFISSHTQFVVLSLIQDEQLQDKAIKLQVIAKKIGTVLGIVVVGSSVTLITNQQDLQAIQMHMINLPFLQHLSNGVIAIWFAMLSIVTMSVLFLSQTNKLVDVTLRDSKAEREAKN
ncbi:MULTISPECIES: MFS transporter [Cysteiniphilum]|nr:MULTISPECIES: MFS transporter [Cysteiniphilum]